MKKVYGLLLLFFVISTTSQAQSYQRLKVMTYNLLNYRNTTSYCDGTNNSSSQKDSYLKTIVGHVQPHILVCEEVGAQSGVPADRILTNALNTGGVNYWAKASYTNNSFSDIVNAAFYDTRYVGLKSQDYITMDANNQSLVRVIDFYRFYYKDSLLADNPDTVFFTVVGVHFKAGSATSDKNDRTAAALAIMQHIQYDVEDDNVILVGDLNLNSGNDAAFQHLINYSVAGVRLYDPMNETGTWYNDYGVRLLHTQSTRNSNTNSGCFSGGGLDDRFDHILVSDEILNGAEEMEVDVNSFTVVGNDGLHLNQALTDGTNLSVPASVLTALYGMSDHLPVTLEFDVRKLSIGLKENTEARVVIRVSQITPNQIQVDWPTNIGRVEKLEVYDINGRLLYTENPTDNRRQITLNPTPAGVYFVRLTEVDGTISHAKFTMR